MARISTQYFDGWPTMAPLGRRESLLVRNNLGVSERVLGQAIGQYGHAVVATSHKVMIVKSGLLSGRILGGNYAEFDYSTIASVELRHSLAMGEIELLAPGYPNSRITSTGYRVNLAERANGVVFTKLEWAPFDALAAKLREMIDNPEHADRAGTPPTEPKSDAMNSGFVNDSTPALSTEERLAEASAQHEAGILTFAEYSRKKVQILTGKKPRN